MSGSNGAPPLASAPPMPAVTSSASGEGPLGVLGTRLDRRIFGLFGQLLEYPKAGLQPVALQCADAVEDLSPEAATRLREFAEFAAATPVRRMEEVYTAVFELDATCHPYVGYHLFGESYKRSMLLLGLKERYRPYGIDSGNELPDHLAVVLRYLAANTDVAEAEVILHEAVQPALRTMLKRKDEEEPPDPSIPRVPVRGAEYRGIVKALREVLLTSVPDDAPVAADVSYELDPMMGC